MDATDFAILGQLAWKPTDPVQTQRGVLRPGGAARALGIHESTVARRLAALEAIGVFEGLHLHPEPTLLGLHSALYAARFPSARARRKGGLELLARPAVWDIHEFVGNETWFGAVAPLDEDLDATAERLARAVGADFVERHHDRSWTTRRTSLARLEYRILQEFVRNAMRPVTEVAQVVGVTPRTLRTRMDALERDRAFALAPQIRFPRIAGVLGFVLDARTTTAGAPGLLAAFPEAIWRRAATGRSFLLLVAEDSAGADAALARAEGIPGVQDARILLLASQAVQVERIVAAVARTSESMHPLQGNLKPQPPRSRPSERDA